MLRAFSCHYCNGPVIATAGIWSCAECAAGMYVGQPLDEEDLERETVYAQYSVEFGTKSRTARLIEMINQQAPGEQGETDTASRIESFKALNGSNQLAVSPTKAKKGKPKKNKHKPSAPKVLSLEERLALEAKHTARIRKLGKVKKGLNALAPQQAANEVAAGCC